MYLRPRGLRLGAFLLLAFAQAHAASYDFNSGQSNFDSSFTSNGGAGNGIATISATGGIGNSGSLSTDGVSNHSIVYDTPIANFNGATFSASLFFLTKPTLATGDLVGIGFLNSTTLLWDAGDSLFYKINGTNSSSLLASNWYKLTATVTNNGASFHPVITLEDYGANGTTPSGSPFNLPASDSSGAPFTTLLASPNVYAGIYGGAYFGIAADYHTPAIDNFAATTIAIPEPSTYGSIAGMAVILLAIWRRRTG